MKIKGFKKIVFGALLFAASCAQMESKESDYYKPEWESLVDYQAPEWYEDAKLGYWPIWGVYSVPAYMGDHAAEWYGRWMYSHEGQSSRNNQGLATYLHHKERYGDPSQFGYKDLIPMFTAERFDANEWAELCVEGGAKYLTALAVFHDNFVMWDSDKTKWNAVDMGPKRDVVKEIKEAAHKHGLKFGVSNHSGWNYCFFMWNHINGYDARDIANQDLYGNPIVAAQADTIRMWRGESRESFENRSRGAVQPSQRDLSRWIERANELVDLYQPDLYYFDWGFNIPIYEPYRREFAAHYYNKSIENGVGVEGAPGVVINYKGVTTFKEGSGVRDIERGGMDGIQDMVWQTDDSIYDGNNWGYAEGIAIKPTDVIIDELMDVISKRGVLMLAIAPRADGTIPEDQAQMMRSIGAWLKVCGEAVYATRPYKVMGEVSKSWNMPNASGYKRYIATTEDIRYTRSKDNKTLYATLLVWRDGDVTIKTLADLDPATIKSISLLGSDEELKWEQRAEGLNITMPQKPDYDYAFPLKISFR